MRVLCNQECLPEQKIKPGGSGWTVLSSVLFLLMPKCALCWAAYMNILSSVGITVRYRDWFLPVAMVLFLLTLIKLLVSAIRKQNYVSVLLAVAAAGIIVAQRSEPEMNFLKISAILMMIAAVMLDKFRMARLT